MWQGIVGNGALALVKRVVIKFESTRVSLILAVRGRRSPGFFPRGREPARTTPWYCRGRTKGDALSARPSSTPSSYSSTLQNEQQVGMEVWPKDMT